jgi:hypothetical protein
MIMNATASTPRRRCAAVRVVDVVGPDVAMGSSFGARIRVGRCSSSPRREG